MFEFWLQSNQLMSQKMNSRVWFLSAIFCIAGCAGERYGAPVVERQETPATLPASHIVARGETLYSIAWRYGIDVRRLIGTNAMNAPYTIYPGQTLRLKGAAKGTVKTADKPGKRQDKVRSREPLSTSSDNVARVPTTAPASTPAIDRKRYPYRWQWPAKGNTLRAFSLTGDVHKGIDIQGNLGEPVHAANSGQVVYAGSGLVGYGKLLIIKHDEHYLSAYGHNHTLLVSEGEWVKVGQRIAEFGDSGTDRVKLHFEVRHDGKPVSPQRVLPAK